MDHCMKSNNRLKTVFKRYPHCSLQGAHFIDVETMNMIQCLQGTPTASSPNSFLCYCICQLQTHLHFYFIIICTANLHSVPVLCVYMGVAPAMLNGTQDCSLKHCYWRVKTIDESRMFF